MGAISPWVYNTTLTFEIVDKYVFFFYALPPDDDDVLALEDLHTLVRDVWLTRHDVQLEEERLARRKGRPRSTKEIKLTNLKEAELEEYRTGIGRQTDLFPFIPINEHWRATEVIDLTHPANVKLFRGWDQKALEYIDLLRFIRISSTDPTSVVVSRPGKHYSLKGDAPAQDSMQED